MLHLRCLSGLKIFSFSKKSNLIIHNGMNGFSVNYLIRVFRKNDRFTFAKMVHFSHDWAIWTSQALANIESLTTLGHDPIVNSLVEWARDHWMDSRSFHSLDLGSGSFKDQFKIVGGCSLQPIDLVNPILISKTLLIWTIFWNCGNMKNGTRVEH